MSQHSSDTALENNMNLEQVSHRQKAQHCKELGRWEDALIECRHALELNLQDWDIYTLMGDVLSISGRWDEAVTAYAEVIEARPDETAVMHRISVALSRLGEINKADDYYTQILSEQANFEKQYPNDFSIQQQAGDYFFRQQMWVRAVEAYQRAVELEPQACWEHINLGRSLTKIDRYPEATAALEKAVELDAGNGWACYYLAEILLLNQENLKDALKWCRKASALMPEQPELKRLRDEIDELTIRLEKERDAKWAAQKQTEDGQRVSAQIEALEGWSESYALGKRLQAKGDAENAIKAYYQSIIQNPQHAWSYHALGDIHLKMGGWHEAIAAYRQALQLNPGYFWSNYSLGIAYRNIGDWQSAVDVYQRSIALNPGENLLLRALEETLKAWYDALVQEGNQYIEIDKEKALDCYRKAVETFSDNIFIPSFSVPRERRENLRVLLIVDGHLDQCMRYRVAQKIEQLEHAGFDSAYYTWENVEDAINEMAFFDVVIFYRTPAFAGVIKAIKYAKAVKKVVFYEIDDLIFDSELFPEPIESYGGHVSEKQYGELIKGTVLFREAMSLCDLAIASTPPLLKAMEKVVGEGNCYLHRNALDSQNVASREIDSLKVKRNYTSIFYGSGTKAHNSDFDELVAPALAQILQQYPDVRITLMGYLTVPDILSSYEDRIDRVGLVKDVLAYYEFLKLSDIAIAVLHPTDVNNCKSELKWFEAASFKIPTVVSSTEVYIETIKNGTDGLIAANAEEWFMHLAHLVESPERRAEIGEAAYARVLKEYSIPAMADNIRNIVSSGIEKHLQAGRIVARSPKKKVLIVNVFYPPQSIGGATRIVKDNVDVLTARYAQDYDISIFTTDNGNPKPYQITEYSHEGVPVTKVSSPMMKGMDWQYYNPKMYEIFKSYLSFHQPDLIHFHCIQRLTASAVQAATHLEIPYLITAHDAWWISDHQFLVNEEGVECDYQQNDPVVMAQDTSSIAESIQRKLYLREQLNGAAGILAVSEAFAQLYRQNGFEQTQANRNGIQPKPVLPRVPSKSGRVRLAHIGGMAAHKGYFLFKAAVEQADLYNTEIIVINHAQTPGTKEYGSWNGVPVTFLSKFKQDDISQLYSMIDVLVAPSMWPESFGLVTREAVAAGVWVVTSDKGAIGEDIVPGKNGEICSVEDAGSLAAILRKIDESFDQYQTINENIGQTRTTDSQVEELTQLYNGVLA